MYRLFLLTWPIFIELFLHIATGSIDVLMLSKVSDEAVAAVGAANQLLYFCIILFGFVAMGTTVVVAQMVGAEKKDDASRIGAVSITINLIFGLIISVLLIFFQSSLLSLFRLDDSLLVIGQTYLQLVGGFIFLEALLLTVSATIKSFGFTRDVMYVVLGINVLNIIGNYLLIFGHFGFPEMGVAGAALSTVISRSIGVIVIFFMLYKRLTITISWRHYFRFERSDLRKIFGIGLPAAGEHISWQTSQMTIMSFIGILGTAALATHIYTFQLLLYIMLFGLAIGQGTEIMVGQMIGAGKKEEAYQQVFKSLKWSLFLTLLIVVGCLFVREPLYQIFTDDLNIIQTGATLLLLTLILEPGRTFNLIIINALRAAGDAKFPVLMGVLSMWGLSVPLAYLLGIHFEWGLPGIYLAFIVDEWLRGLLMLIRWRSRVWESKTLV